MTDGDALLAAIRANPDDDTPRLAYADCLDENGQHNRAMFIRVQCELARTSGKSPHYPALWKRQHDLQSGFDYPWQKDSRIPVKIGANSASLKLADFERGIPVVEIEYYGEIDRFGARHYFGDEEQMQVLFARPEMQEAMLSNVTITSAEDLNTLRHSPYRNRVRGIELFIQANQANEPAGFYENLAALLSETPHINWLHIQYTDYSPDNRLHPFNLDVVRDHIQPLINILESNPIRKLSLSGLSVFNNHQHGATAIALNALGRAKAHLDSFGIREWMVGGSNVLPEILSMPTLLSDVKNLDFSHCHMGASHMVDIGNAGSSGTLGNLRHLDVSHNQISGRGTSWIRLPLFSQLVSMDLRENHVNKKEMMSLFSKAETMPNLFALEMFSNRRSDRGRLEKDIEEMRQFLSARAVSADKHLDLRFR